MSIRRDDVNAATDKLARAVLKAVEEFNMDTGVYVDYLYVKYVDTTKHDSGPIKLPIGVDVSVDI
jgi:hypothetical protein